GRSLLRTAKPFQAPAGRVAVGAWARSDLDDHRDQHGSAPVAFADPAADAAADQLAELGGVVDAFGGGPFQGFLDLGDDVVVGFDVDAGAAGVDLGFPDEFAGGGLHHDDHGDEALLAEDAAVLEGGFGDVSDGGAVDVDVSGLDDAGDSGPALVEVDDDAVLGDDDAVLGHSAEHGEVGVGAQVPPFAVDRHEVAGPDHVEHVQQFPGGSVPGDVDQGVALVDDLGAPAGEAVDDPVDGVLVAGDEGGGQD